jgi:hypothetical protein
MVLVVVPAALLPFDIDEFDIELLPEFELVVAGVMAGVLTGATLVMLALLFALLALTFTLAPESPQAIPRALRPRTVESTITFFIS